MLISKTKYMSYLGMCPAAVGNSLVKLKSLIDSKIKTSTHEPDIEMETLGYLFDEMKFQDVHPEFMDIELEMLLRQGNILETKFREQLKDRLKVTDSVDLNDMADNYDKAEATKKELEKGTKLIFGATFIYKKGEKECIVIVDALDNKNKAIYEFKSTTTSKIKHLFELSFQYKVLEACGYKVNNMYLSLVDYVKSKKGNMKIGFTEFCNLSKSAPSVSKKKKEEMTDSQLLDEKRYIKLSKQREYSMIELTINPDKIEVALNPKNTASKADKTQMAKLILSTPLDSIMVDIEKYAGDYYGMDDYCINPFMTCLFIKQCRAYEGLTKDQYNYSGNVISLTDALNIDDSWNPKDIFKCCSEKAANTYYEKINAFATGEIWKDKDGIKDICNEIEENKIVWFDFETVNTPISLLDDTVPYTQIVFQNSFIRTEPRLNETDRKNMIIDPSKVNLQWYKDVIDSLYWEGAKYVVYNKGFESARLKEMAAMLKDEKYNDMVEEINDNMIDLADPFTFNKGASCAKAKLVIPDLKGTYSIKYIEKYVTKNNLPMKDTIRPYSELEITNGAMAMMEGLAKVYGITTEDDWKIKEEQLKDYCENDVLAMIMTYKLLKFEL